MYYHSDTSLYASEYTVLSPHLPFTKCVYTLSKNGWSYSFWTTQVLYTTSLNEDSSFHPISLMLIHNYSSAISITVAGIHALPTFSPGNYILHIMHSPDSIFSVGVRLASTGLRSFAILTSPTIFPLLKLLLLLYALKCWGSSVVDAIWR